MLADTTRVLGEQHRDTLVTRFLIGDWTGHAGDPRRAVRLLRRVLDDMNRALGPEDFSTLGTRFRITAWVLASDDRTKAVRLLEDLLVDLTRILGPDHPHTEATRVQLAEVRDKTTGRRGLKLPPWRPWS